MDAEEAKGLIDFEALKEFVATEFLWILFILIISIPLAFVFLWMLGFTDSTVEMTTERDKDYLTTLYIVGYVLSVVGIYLIRMIVSAIKTVVGSGGGGAP